MEEAKIQFSPEELSLIQNSDWILTKNAIIEKIYQGFGSLSVQMQTEVSRRMQVLPEIVVASTPKISRGEKYQALPYVILDYPRVFEKAHVLAIRTMFWWGNYFSVTLHVKGQFVPGVLRKIISTEFDGTSNLYISLSGNEWNHDLNSRDFQPLKFVQKNCLENLPADQSFVKLSAKFEVGQWEGVYKKMNGIFPVLLRLIEI